MHAAWRGLGGDAVVDLQEIDRADPAERSDRLSHKPICPCGRYVHPRRGRSFASSVSLFKLFPFALCRRRKHFQRRHPPRAPGNGRHPRAGTFRLIAAALSLAISRPLRFASALRLAMRISTPGVRGRLWPLAYLLEASFLGRRLKQKKIRHLHNHLGRNSAAVAMLRLRTLSGVSVQSHDSRPDRI